MPIVARAVFGIVNWAARKGLAEDGSAAVRRDATSAAHAKHAARRTGIRGETFAYWYLRRHGYTIIARNFMVPGMKGEIDLAGYDGEVLAFIEVKTRTISQQPLQGLKAHAISRPDVTAEAVTPEAETQRSRQPIVQSALPEEAVTREKRRHLVRIARQFLAEWRIKEAQCRFDVLAIESQPGAAPRVRLHKDCFGSSATDFQ